MGPPSVQTDPFHSEYRLRKVFFIKKLPYLKKDFQYLFHSTAGNIFGWENRIKMVSKNHTENNF